MKTITLSILALSLNLYAKPEVCVEEKQVIFESFVALDIDKDRTTVGIDQVQSVKTKILEYVTANPSMTITDIALVSSSAKIPFYKIVAKKRVYDPQEVSDSKNTGLAKERAEFAKTVLNEIKTSRSELAQTTTSVTHVLAGPDFQPLDWNDRFVTKMTPDYEKKVGQLFETNKAMFENEAVIKSSAELMDESKFATLFHAKYKPFNGIRISLSGFKKCKSAAEKSNSPSGRTQ